MKMQIGHVIIDGKEQQIFVDINKYSDDLRGILCDIDYYFGFLMIEVERLKEQGKVNVAHIERYADIVTYSIKKLKRHLNEI